MRAPSYLTPRRAAGPTSYLTPQKLHQFLVQLVVEFVGFLGGLCAVFDGLEFLRAFPADVYAENFAALRKFRDDAFEGFESERTLVPVGGGKGGRERVLVNGKVKVRRPLTT